MSVEFEIRTQHIYPILSEERSRAVVGGAGTEARLPARRHLRAPFGDPVRKGGTKWQLF